MIDNNKINLKKLFAFSLAVYFLIIICFFFLAGDQLKYRASRGNVEPLPAESGTIELAAGQTVEQVFKANIQRLESVSVQWGTYYRPNYGNVIIELVRENDGEILLSGNFDASTIGEWQFVTVDAERPIENVYDTALILRLYSDSAFGSAVNPLMNSSLDTVEGFSLRINGEEIPGTLCFSATGTDYIWTGLHYWELSAGIALVIIAVMAYVLFRVKNGKHSYIANAISAMKKYRFLISQLVSRDFKTKYKRSVLGVFWSFLNPLLMMIVQYFVFSKIFRSDLPNYAAYLIIGTVMFNFFSEATSMTLTSILWNANLIKKVYMPKYIYPLTRTLSSVVNFAISLIPLIIVCLITGVTFKPAALLSFFFMVCIMIFSLGFGMLLSTSMVFFRDTQFLWNVLNMIWMYATPLFYPETILPQEFGLLLKLNPLYYFIKCTRMCILDGLSPEPIVYIQCLAMALGMLFIGAFIFRKEQDKFVLYL